MQNYRLKYETIKFTGLIKRKIKKYTKRDYPLLLIFFKILSMSFKEFLKQCFSYQKAKGDKLKICFYLQGGVGDIIVYNTFLKEFLKLAKNYEVDIYPTLSPKISKALYKGFDFKFKDFNNYQMHNIPYYDLIMEFQRVAILKYANPKRIKALCPELIEPLEKLDNLQKNYPFIFENEVPWDTIPISKDLGIALGKTRETLPDLANAVNLSSKTKKFLPLEPKSFDILEKYNLKDKKFITIHRGLDGNVDMQNCIRLWPLEYYNSLIKSLKEKYKDIPIVQLGISKERCETFDNIDIDLIGKTTFEEVEAILKYSSLHIDYEGGFVHLRHFMNKISCVLFGQTTIDFVGYKENLNLKSDACPMPCENLRNDWANRCLRGFEKAPCMWELKPDYVFNNLVPILDKILNYEKTEILDKNIKEYFENNEIENKKIVFFGIDFLDKAKELALKNDVIVYDNDIKDFNFKIQSAKDMGVNLEYGDIYNIDEIDSSVDLAVVDFSKVKNLEFAKRELKRITKETGFILYDKKETKIYADTF